MLENMGGLMGNRYLSAQANSVADLVQNVLVNYAVPARRRGAYTTRRVSIVSRLVLEAYRPKIKDAMGNLEEKDRVDDALQSLLERQILRWNNPHDSTANRKRVYNLIHRTGVPVLVIVHG